MKACPGVKAWEWSPSAAATARAVRQNGGVIVITRYSVSEADVEAFRADAAKAVEVLSRRPGYRGYRLGRAADDPALWTVVTEWDGAGFYRRALSDFDVKIHAVPLLSRAIDEPTAFEIMDAEGPTPPAF